MPFVLETRSNVASNIYARPATTHSYPYIRSLADAALVHLELRERDKAALMIDEAGALAKKVKDEYTRWLCRSEARAPLIRRQ